MITTSTLLELNQIIEATHGDPHHILGIHPIEINKEKALVVRVFIPQAQKVFVLDPQDKAFLLELKKVHLDGFFESIVPDRIEPFQYLLRMEGFDGSIWESYDPYAFAPTISDLDLHLFGEGTHYEIYEKLGAHFKTIDSVPGVTFAVWAPNAKRVSVIGEFNSWDGRRNPMRILKNSGVWELFIPGLKQCDNYKFEIKCLNGELIQKSDPYANFAELKPSTSSLLYDINQYEWNDQAWYERLKKTPPLDNAMNIYEVHLGSWKKNEAEDCYMSYMEMVEELIPYVVRMGYTHIELMPVLEYPFDGSWGYQVTGYFAPTSRYGTPDEFMYFIDQCHQNNIGVLLDWVPAHFPKDAHGLARFDGTAVYEHEDPRKGEHPEWGTLIFNYGRKEVKNFLIGSAIFWIEKYHIDGLRVDAVASMLYLDYGKQPGQWVPNEYGGKENNDAVEFLRHMNSIILGKHPNVLMIAEESTSWPKVSRPVEEGGLGFNLKWNMGWMNDYLTYITKDPVFRRYHHNNLTFGMVYAYTENFVLVLSHDEVVHGKRSMLDKMPGDIWQKCANLRLSYAFLFGHPGKKLTFMGMDFGQFIEWDEKKSLDWFLLEYEHHAGIQKYVHDLNHLYKREPAFWYDDFKGNGFEWINCDDANRSLLVFIRKAKNSKDTLIFVCNFTPNPIEDYQIGVPFQANFREVLNSDSTIYGGSGVINDLIISSQESQCDGFDYSIQLRVPPLGATVLKVE